MTSLNSVQSSAKMCTPFHLVVRADYSYFFLPGKGEWHRDVSTFADLQSFCKNLPPKKKKKKKKKTLHIVAEFNIDFEYPYHNSEGEVTYIAHGR